MAKIEKTEDSAYEDGSMTKVLLITVAILLLVTALPAIIIYLKNFITHFFG